MSDWKEEILKKWAEKEKVQKVEISDALRDRLTKEIKGEILYREPMSRHTSIRIGGMADVFIKPTNQEDLGAVLKIAHEEKIPFFLLGSGSNTLVKDDGIRGFVIATIPPLQMYRVLHEGENEGDVFAEAGVGITVLVNFTRDQSLSGMESLMGIPGTIGGAVIMNAGAQGTEIKDVVREVTFMDRDGKQITLPREKLEFSYRHLKVPHHYVALSAVFRLQKGNRDEIAERIKNFQKQRIETQPLNYPNLGSVFKNPAPTTFAAQMIEEAGLKGVRVGGARVSNKHANFIINEKGAKAKDVLILINLIRDKVKEATGVLLETEVKVIGEGS